MVNKGETYGENKRFDTIKRVKPYEPFSVDEVLEDPQTHQDILSIIFGRDIPLLEQNETEKELRVSPHLRAVRMDVYAMDEEKSVYNTEMQQKKKDGLGKAQQILPVYDRRRPSGTGNSGL